MIDAHTSTAGHPKANPWFRLYAEFGHDPKVQVMAEAMQRRLLMLMCLRCSNALETLHETEIAFYLRISDEETAKTKALFVTKGFIDDDWNLLNWEKRQFASDSSTARVAEHRKRKKEACNEARNDDETLQKRKCNRLDTDTDTDTDKPPISPVPGEGVVDQVVEAYHSHLPRCMRCSTMTPKRKKRIQHADKLARSVCAKHGWDYDPVVFWDSYFAECSNDPWMSGNVPNPKNAKWKQNLDVLIADDRFAQVMDVAISTMSEAA